MLVAAAFITILLGCLLSAHGPVTIVRRNGQRQLHWLVEYPVVAILARLRLASTLHSTRACRTYPQLWSHWIRSGTSRSFTGHANATEYARSSTLSKKRREKGKREREPEDSYTLPHCDEVSQSGLVHFGANRHSQKLYLWN